MVAVVLNPASIAERKLFTQEVDHIAGYPEKLVAFQNAILRLQNAELEQWRSNALASTECHELKEFWLHEFFWQPGSYTVKVSAKVAELRSHAKAEFRFQLTDAEIQALKNNARFLSGELSNIFTVTARPCVAESQPRDTRTSRSNA